MRGVSVAVWAAALSVHEGVRDLHGPGAGLQPRRFHRGVLGIARSGTGPHRRRRPGQGGFADVNSPAFYEVNTVPAVMVDPPLIGENRPAPLRHLQQYGHRSPE